MFALLHSLAMFFVDLFKPRRRLETEDLFLRHQLRIAVRRAPPRLWLRGSDRAPRVWMTRLWPTLFNTTRVVQPETNLRWYRAGAWSLDIRLSTTSRGAAIPDICAFYEYT